MFTHLENAPWNISSSPQKGGVNLISELQGLEMKILGDRNFPPRDICKNKGASSHLELISLPTHKSLHPRISTQV